MKKSVNFVLGIVLPSIMLVVISLVLCMSCGIKEERMSEKDIPIVEIEGCAYLKSASYGFNYTYTHLGNCLNPVHPENWTKEKWQQLLNQ
jgi:hypothetical protein